MDSPSTRLPALQPLPLLGALIAVVTAVRLATLVFSPLNLHYDEAQYWAWSRELAWGYFSKPPLIAWVIATTTGLFGNAEWAVRIGAPLAHAVGAVGLGLLGRRLFGDWAGFWAGAMWIVMPGVWLSAGVMSTDALLLPSWAWALYCFWRLIDTPSWRWAIGLGCLLGLGLLAKYAMIYFAVSAGLAALWSPKVRAGIVSRYGAAAAGVAAVIVAPNLAWNAANDFATVGHTASNANLSGALFHPAELMDFWVSQIAVVGPAVLVALVTLLVFSARRPASLTDADKVLIAFVLPALAVISVQALLSRAHANWAAAAYPAAVVWLSGRLLTTRIGRITLGASAGLHALVGATFLSMTVSPALADAIGIGGAFKRARGWEVVCERTQEETRAAGDAVSAVLVDHRALYYALRYYCGPERGAPLAAPLRMWVLGETPENQAAATAAMTPDLGDRVLVVHMSPHYVEAVHGDFLSAGPVREWQAPIGGGRTRWIGYSLAEGFERAPRDEAYFARVRGEDDED